MNMTLSGNVPKRNLIIEIIASLLLIFFVYTLFSSYIQLQSLKNLLAFYTANTTMVAWIMIISELIISVLLFTPSTRLIGFILALFCAISAGSIVLARPYIPHNFGGIINHLTRNQQLYLYVVLSIIAISGILQILLQRKNGKDSQLIRVA